MTIYFETLQQFQASGGMKATTITAKQLLPAVVAHMQRMDRKFTLQVNGRLPKSMDALLEEVFDLCHLQQPFYTQHCANRSLRYIHYLLSDINLPKYFKKKNSGKKLVAVNLGTDLFKILNTLFKGRMGGKEFQNRLA